MCTDVRERETKRKEGNCQNKEKLKNRDDDNMLNRKDPPDISPCSENYETKGKCRHMLTPSPFRHVHRTEQLSTEHWICFFALPFAGCVSQTEHRLCMHDEELITIYSNGLSKRP